MKKMLVSLSILLLSSPAFPAEVKLVASWDYPVEAESTIVGYRFYDANRVMVLEGVIPAAREAVITTDTDGKTCLPFYMTAVAADGEEAASNIYAWCPPKKMPKAPAVFRLDLK